MSSKNRKAIATSQFVATKNLVGRKDGIDQIPLYSIAHNHKKCKINVKK